MIQKMMIGLNQANIMTDNPECGSGNFLKIKFIKLNV